MLEPRLSAGDLDDAVILGSGLHRRIAAICRAAPQYDRYCAATLSKHCARGFAKPTKLKGTEMKTTGSPLAAGAIALCLLTGGTRAQAEDLPRSLGTIEPNKPLITTVGSKKIIAFFVSNNHSCAVQTVVWEKGDENATSATGVRLILKAEDTMNVAGSWGSLIIKCGKDAATMDVLETRNYVLSAK